MKKDDLLKLIASGETETVEFKESPNETFYKTISALANTKGGTTTQSSNCQSVLSCRLY